HASLKTGLDGTLIPLRKLTLTDHPYLIGGGISGALIAGTVVAFVWMTALVSQTPLPGATSTVLPSPPGTLTVGGGDADALAPTGPGAPSGPATGPAGAAAIPSSGLLATGPLSGPAVGTASGLPPASRLRNGNTGGG